MSGNRPVLLLGGRSRSTWIIARHLRDRGIPLIIALEQRPSQIAMLKWRARRLGILTVFGQTLFLAFARLASRGSEKQIQNYLMAADFDDRPLEVDEVRSVETVNSDEVVRLIQETEPAAIVVNGTRIIKSKVLGAAEVPFINTHCGITPKYRGVHGGYWALVRNDAENCGVTVHLVDVGVDTGGVLYQSKITPSSQDNFFTYPILQVIAAMPLLLKALNDAQNGSLRPVAGVGPSKQWYHPTIWGYFWTGIRQGVW